MEGQTHIHVRIHVHFHTRTHTHTHTHTFTHVQVHVRVRVFFFVIACCCCCRCGLWWRRERRGDKPKQSQLIPPQCPSGLLKLNGFIRHSECLEESATCCSRSVFKLKTERSTGFFEPLKHVITLRGLFLVSRTGDDLPCVGFKNASVGTFKTSPCVAGNTRTC